MHEHACINEPVSLKSKETLNVEHKRHATDVKKQGQIQDFGKGGLCPKCLKCSGFFFFFFFFFGGGGS